MKNLFLNKNHLTEFLVLIISSIISILFAYYFLTNNNQNLADYDAIARLNIARKMIDSLTPGLGQLGGIWLPFPQVLFIPIIWIDSLWRTGIAGTIISASAFILSCVFVYKTSFILTKSTRASILAWLLYSTNINLLYLQSTAMSESFFLLCLILVIYYLTKWSQNRKILDLLFAATAVVFITLTRYEGYIVFISAVLSVFLLSEFRLNKISRSKSEGLIIAFTTFASFGILVWTLNSALIYKDPLHWLNLYSGKKSVVTNQAIQSTEGTQLLTRKGAERSIEMSASIYLRSMAYMNGLVVSAIGVISMVFVIVYTSFIYFRKRNIPYHFIPLFLVSSIMFLFLIVGYNRGLIPAIEVPKINMETIVNKQFNLSSSSNIRYGLFVLPFLVFYIAIFVGRKSILMVSVICLLTFQIYTNYFTKYFLIFQLPVKQTFSIPPYAKWFKEHYTTGLVLVSANRHEPFMMLSGIPYKNYIYEGSQQYWLNSLSNPSKHARWVVRNTAITGDSITTFMKNEAELKQKFKKVYSDNTGVEIYELK